ncbi:MAG: primosomal protein N' [Planctomycetaceae bacterium]
MSDARQQQLFTPEPVPLPFELAAEADRLFAQVVFNRPLEDTYTYIVPDGLRERLRPGMRVKVPFGRGNSLETGYCVGLTREPPTSRRLKEVAELLDREPLLSEAMLDLTRWMGERYLCGWGQVLETVVPAGVKAQAGTRQIVCFVPSANLAERVAALKLPKKQQRVVDVLLAAGRPLTGPELAEAADCSPAPIQTLREKGLILGMEGRSELDVATTGPVDVEADLVLNAEQQKAFDRVLRCIESGRHETMLLHGVTGSGKTEVYIRAIREVVSYGRQAIVLVPEISLTPQTIRRFRRRFPSVAVLHSHLSDVERHRQWKRIEHGEVQVIVGARSAIFAPAPHLGLIVIDEEHETTFKQQTTPRYHAREVARERCRREGVPLILGSATPTLESLQRARDKHDLFLTLPKRVEARPLPPVSLVDTRNDPHVSKGHSIGRALRNAIDLAIRDAGQVILFLNLRGYSPVLWCLTCQAGVQCPDCDITLTWHRDRQKMLCHSCLYEAPPPTACPKCGHPGLRYIGSGTQRLEAEVRTKFPNARVLRMDSDSMRKPGSHDEALEAFRQGQVDILLGTQMIAKGLDFPQVTLVGVIDADTLLHQPDLRAAERTFQLIAQVAGRTGRGERQGRVLVQTMNPDQPVIQFASRHDYFGFAKMELESRQRHHQPPFAALARVVMRGINETQVQEAIKGVAATLRAAIAAEPEPAAGSSSGSSWRPVKILGPAPAPVLRLRKQFRYHMLLTAETPEQLATLWRRVKSDIVVPDDIEMTIDVDPVDMR